MAVSVNWLNHLPHMEAISVRVRVSLLYVPPHCGCNSVARVSVFQTDRRGFDSLHPLLQLNEKDGGIPEIARFGVKAHFVSHKPNTRESKKIGRINCFLVQNYVVT